MTETATDAAAASARAAEQARLRKERREAKIRAGGASRLNKITGLGGGVQRDPPPPVPQDLPAPEPTSSPAAGATPAREPQHHADPEEVDISEHYYAPQTTARIPAGRPADDISEAQLRQMMLGFDGVGPGTGLDPGADGGDPMMKLLQQMMGGGPGGPGGPNPFAAAGGNPFGPGSPFAAQAAAAGAPRQTVVTDRYSALWRLLHTAVALGLGLYIALWTSFAGTKLQRAESSVTGSIGRTTGRVDGAVAEGDEARFASSRFFWAFATAEAVLLTTRYFFDRSRTSAPGGLLSLAVGFLPPPFKGYVEIAMRYGQIFSTVRADVLVCIFVLGVCSWLRA